MKFTNRKIKFRVWTGATMEYKVLAGALGHFYVEGMSKTDSACLSDANTIYSPEAPLMQWTGLVDKNGVEIYEGDVVNIFNHTSILANAQKEEDALYETEFIKDKFSFTLLNGKFMAGCGGLYDTTPSYKVVGNIFQNPELLAL